MAVRREVNNLESSEVKMNNTRTTALERSVQKSTVEG